MILEILARHFTYCHERHVRNCKYKTNSGEYRVPSYEGPIFIIGLNSFIDFPKNKNMF